jgi:hypothetical protein
VALSPTGDVYVSDGYGNARVHRFSPDGELLQSWGEPGSGAGQFRLVHGIAVDREGVVYVGDRMNTRVQLFSPQGEYIAEWNDVYHPNDLFIDDNDRIFITEGVYNPSLPLSGPKPAPEDSYPRVSIRSLDGKVLASITSPDPRAPGGLLSPHAVRADSRGNVYVGELPASRAKKDGLNRHDYHTLQKFVRVRD